MKREKFMPEWYEAAAQAGKGFDDIALEHAGVEFDTEKAVLINFDGDKVWLPKSQIVELDDEGVIVTAWVAHKKALSHHAVRGALPYEP